MATSETVAQPKPRVAPEARRIPLKTRSKRDRALLAKLKTRLAAAHERRKRIADELTALTLEVALARSERKRIALRKKRDAALDWLTEARAEALRLEAELRRKERFAEALESRDWLPNAHSSTGHRVIAPKHS